MKPVLASILAAQALLAAATDIYVSVDGSDTNTGDSEDNPFRTLSKAQKTVRGLTEDALLDDVNVHIAPGKYVLSAPLQFHALDSGNNGFAVNWIGSNATISGGLEVKGWTVGDDGVYSAEVPNNTQSRNLFVGGQAANYARRMINDRTAFTFTENGMSWSDPAYDWLMTTDGIDNAEVRFINSFTDRYAPIEAVRDRELIMKQHSWANQLIGYDMVSDPHDDFGVWVQNSRALLTEGGEFFLDSEVGKVYYMPLEGEDMDVVDAYLGIQETLLSIGGTYDDPSHHISFHGLEFAHSTWLRPQNHGFVDQQTGGYIGENTTWPEFEATRPDWWQMPSAVQISAASNIALSGCTYSQLGAGGIGIGNDDNAHLTEVGLGSSNITIMDGYFTQVMGNSVTAGGIKANSHHPDDQHMLNTEITISGNIFYNNSALFSSTVNILATYLQSSTISHNDIHIAPYSGLCHGYGWGANDEGGSPEYINRGLYQYQPLYTTPTIMKDNIIDGNLIHGYGRSHTDLGGIYTLSRAPGTLVSNNYVYDAGWFGIYPDEGSGNITFSNNECFSNGGWYSPNDWSEDLNTGYNTVIDNWGKVGEELDGFPDHSGRRGNTFLRNYIVGDVSETSLRAQRAAYRAGVLPGARAGRPVSNNDNLADGYLSLGPGNDGTLAVNLTNFDDVDLTDLSFKVSAEDAVVDPIDVPTSVLADSFAVATYNIEGANELSISARASYKNPRTGQSREVSASGTISLSGARG